VIPITETPPPHTLEPGFEPLSGYRLISRLGRGGYGEVWKCVAPGGLFKAVKFVPVRGDGYRQELAAFEQIKSIRHPFLITLERVEQQGQALLMVMELADGQLGDRLRECNDAGRQGIPREELLGYLRDVAEALDTMGSKYGLQHLDVKPENIFLMAGHAKVGDYGQVCRADVEAVTGGFTPKYTAPEVLTGQVDIRSDQYSLALVYAEMLTGSFPYKGKSAQQYMIQHLRAVPELDQLPAADRAAVERALSKDPADRFPSCQAFVRELNTPSTPGKSAIIAGMVRSPDTHLTCDRKDVSPLTPVEANNDPFADLSRVMPVARLHQPSPRVSELTPMPWIDLVEAVVRAAVRDTSIMPMHPEIVAEQVRFPSTIPVHIMPYKLVLVAEEWGLSARQVGKSRVVLVKVDRPPGTRWGRTYRARGWYEVVVDLPVPPAFEVSAAATVYGLPDQAFLKVAAQDLPAILDQVRTLLQNLKDRRLHPRHAFDTPVRVFPLLDDGKIGSDTTGRLIDLSLGGVRFVTPRKPLSDRLFVQFPDVPEVSGHAVYTRVLRSVTLPGVEGVESTARFRRSE
jgi:serine/threonine protein kinase